MSLRERLIARIADQGPIRVSDYMSACLHDPDDGYYARRPNLGPAGDFITAPLVSQIFGELLGLWSIEIWERLGRPGRVRLVELGPGDGAMMRDVLRAGRVSPAFLAAAEVWLVETSAPLRAAQAVNTAGAPVRWIDHLDAAPTDAPVILLANEFLDCLPIEQWVRSASGCRERRIGLDERGALAFVVERGDGRWRLGDPADAILESSSALAGVGQTVGELFAVAPGAGLFIDYGRDAPGFGDTLQALRGHRKESPLAHPGLADITAHVDFPAFLDAARRGGAATTALQTQGVFLQRMGLEARANALISANPDKADLIARQCQRLTAPDHMGELFKVACVHSPGLQVP